METGRQKNIKVPPCGFTKLHSWHIPVKSKSNSVLSILFLFTSLCKYFHILAPYFHCSTGCIKIFWEINIIVAKLIGPQILSSVCWAGPRSFEASRWEPQHSLLCFPTTRWRLSTGLWSATKRCRALQDLLITNADLIEIRPAQEAACACVKQKKKIYFNFLQTEGKNILKNVLLSIWRDYNIIY